MRRSPRKSGMRMPRRTNDPVPGKRRVKAERTEPAGQERAHEKHMRAALGEATRALGRTSPNPSVGAVVVKDGKILARGHTQPVGGAHAEVMALQAAGARARGAELYTTLEPCDHQGRTPPCSLAILDAGIRKVVTASSDPNPRVDGRGVARLRSGGVEVVTGVLREAADVQHAPFFKFLRSGLPYVTLKAAVTLDGKLATGSGDSKWVTGELARARVHALRNQVDAVLVGRNTVTRDDPQLTTRLPAGDGHDPVRVVLDSSLRMDVAARMLRSGSLASTVVIGTSAASSRRAAALRHAGAEVWQVAASDGHVDMETALRALAKAGLQHVLVEGGAAVFGSVLRAGLADELWLFMAPKILGSEGESWVGPLGLDIMADALRTGAPTTEILGEDVLLRVRFL